MKANSVFCLFALIVLTGASRTASAQTTPRSDTPPGKRTLQITVPESGEYIVRILPGASAKEKNLLPSSFKDKKTSVEIETAMLGKSPRIAIDDVKTGNSAIVAIPAGAEIVLHKSDFEHVRVVNVNVTFEGKPVKTALVTLTTADKASSTQTVDAAAKGIAQFEDVPVGKATIKLVYGENLKESREVDLSSDHAGQVVSIPAAVANKVETLDVAIPTTTSTPSANVGPGAAEPGTSTAADAAKPTGGGLAGLIGNFLGLAVAVGALYALFRWSQSGGMAATLKKVGVEVSGPAAPSAAGTPWAPNAAPPPVVADPAACQFCGQVRDTAGNCACALAGGAASSVGASPVIASQPRLVATVGVYSGSVFPLLGGSVTMGRDAGNGIPLTNDTTVSRKHASVRQEGTGYVVADEGSSNGVFVNGVRINGAHTLNPGDEVQVGNTRFRFEL